MRILLINSGNDPGIGGNANAESWPALNIISLGTAVELAFGDRVELMLLDGQLETVDEIVAKMEHFRPNVVGVSLYCTSLRNALQIVLEAKNVGAVTVLGNDHASFHYETLLSKIREVDFICTNDVGEQTLVALIEYLCGTRNLDEVPSLAFRTGDAITVSRASPLVNLNVGSGSKSVRHATSLNSLPIPNRKLLPAWYWSSYLSTFQAQHHKTFDPMTIKGVATINRARGCARAKDPCRYCGIADLTPRGSSGEMFWADARLARDQIGADYLYEAFDSATSWPSLIEEWANKRPDDMANTRFKMYAQASETNAKTVELFSRLGVICINTGFDSGDDETLKLLKGSRDSVEVNRRAARLWSDAGIEIYCSFVLVGLGDEGKTRKSLDATLEFVNWLADNTTTVSLDTALLYPDKSSTVGRWIWDPSLAEGQAHELGWDFIDFEILRKVSHKWRDEVFLDPIELSADFSRICGVRPELLLEYARDIEKVANDKLLNFGRSQGGPLD